MSQSLNPTNCKANPDTGMGNTTVAGMEVLGPVVGCLHLNIHHHNPGTRNHLADFGDYEQEQQKMQIWKVKQTGGAPGVACAWEVV